MLRTFFLTLAITLFSFIGNPVLAANAPSFDDYKVCLQDAQVEPVIQQDSDFWVFRERIVESAKNTCINFDGEYTLIEWSCGEACENPFIHNGVVMDTDGTLYWLPAASQGYDYRLDSALFVVNPALHERYTYGNIPANVFREFYRVTDGKFTLIYRDKGESLVEIVDPSSPPDCQDGCLGD